ncbi:MAG: hypothetical protein H6811_08550 [Phycisphaeraceae bacterium]|nr:hypothetical protein [Phycisphaeraceae bacterium]
MPTRTEVTCPVRPRIRAGALWMAMGLFAIASAAGGCQRSLFAGETSRSPFDSFDRRRNTDAPPYYYDSFGTRRPNIRERLKPRS